ncbi:leucine--tRNA ligase [Candidatus Roizmanbacteria bacterium RIFCSPLOWO2_01_FULL_41_22]|uniref:Leucine--tRNA ligase n=1 Tax=Candidatus Roizmanbacteria bacterium RIFCSPLOWO2_01_FULL_41_22 TaxID=1802067 RepID=A0A1F7J963_9BACT|nr:MAG: leucine--tRNA ligase [Candidatus Roizmanbacteria bacterium RIFCSPLOWO2_01_FULL_41_22]
MKKYIPQEFEKKWIDYWLKEKTYQTPQSPDKKKKMYVLDMFPYPSGAGLHVGHPRGYTASDILARYYRMNGYAVLHPMGWDAFGLPAENAAIKAKKNPLDMVPRNIANFKRQMSMLGFSYDWERELATTDPEYYQWTQWLFIQFFKMGLLYKKNVPIHYCPVCKTGLAEEEVLSDGTHERCGNPITKKDLPQWIFRITAYADRLLEDLQGLNWPPGILEMQKNWIGKKTGITITYPVVAIGGAGGKETSDRIYRQLGTVSCFTTRPDTNFGATFIVLAPEHPFVASLLNSKLKNQKSKLEEIKKYVEQAKTKTEVERMLEGRKKTGVFTRLYALNQLNGKPMPVWISDFVLAQFGTGAVVGVPGHDLRDFEFASQFGIEVKRVVVGSDGDTSPISKKAQVQEEEGKMVNSDFLNGLDIHQATKKMMDYLEEKGWGKREVSYHIRDWIFSRQRYWGEPIPMIFCAECAKNQVKSQTTSENLKLEIENSLSGWFPVPEAELPVKLPYVKSYEPIETGESPLARINEFVETTCPNCGGKAKRETDTMPNWAGSCWYFLAFANPQILNSKFLTLNSNWLPVDWYIGGAEHAVLHLLYSRFWVKALNDLGLIKAKEPFIRLRNVGMILAEDNRKMSKSLGNVINPDEVVAEFGADSLRMYEMFMAPFSQEIAWSTKALQGVYRFLGRVWKIFQSQKSKVKSQKWEENKILVSKLNKTIEKVGRDILDFKFNTAIAAMMEFVNSWEAAIQLSIINFQLSNKNEQKDTGQSQLVLSADNAKKFLKILAPFAPFLAEEIWQTVLGEEKSIHRSSWPKIDREIMIKEDAAIPVQVNGKVRAVITVVATETSQENVVKKALQEERIQKYVEGKKYQVIYVKGKILNLVLS